MRREFLKVALMTAAAIALASEAAQAKLTLPIVTNYGEAVKPEIWKGFRKGEIPSSLVRSAIVANPSKARQAPYDKVFLQNDRFVVCYADCAAAQPVAIHQGSAAGDYSVGYDATVGALGTKANAAALKTANVYYWVNRLMDELQTVNFRPKKRLLVRVERDVVDPTGASAMSNNAFFNEKDWSLSFLPVRAARGLLASDTHTLTSPALDPSVAMHETMHAVFQEAIGPILNREIFGLHEAFADYFALDIVNDQRLGVVFASGSPIRKNDAILKYKVGMEAHALGNVVSSALWKIRGQIGDRMKARSLAFRTIETLARSPYLAAGDVARIHLALAKEMQLGDALVAEIEKTWAETELIPSAVDPRALQAPTSFEAFPRLAATVSTNVPDAVTVQWGLPKEDMSRISLFGAATQEGQQDMLWLHAGVERKGQPVRSIRILMSAPTQIIRAAFDRDGRLIEAADAAAFADLKIFSDGFGDVLKWLNGSYKPMADLMSGQGELAKLLKAQDIKTEPMTIKMNGQSIPVVRHTFTVRPHLWARAMLALLSPEAAEQLSSIDSIALYSADAAGLPMVKAFPQVVEGRHLVGISIRTASGVVRTSILSGFQMPNQTLGAISLMR